MLTLSELQEGLAQAGHLVFGCFGSNGQTHVPQRFAWNRPKGHQARPNFPTAPHSI